MRSPTHEVMRIVAQRFRSYLAADISREFSEHDDMVSPGEPRSLQHYFAVGRSAIDIIAQAMIAGRRSEFATVLDLPCGGGRVTRHLARFLPATPLFVGDLNRRNERFVARTFGATPVEVAPDFSGEPPRTFDLIFVASLVTHFDAPLFDAAVAWFSRALADDGILVLTTHGRRTYHLQYHRQHLMGPDAWAPMGDVYTSTGFGYLETERTAAGSYGFSICRPSWLMRLVETEPAIRIIGFHEGAWDDHQDALVLQKCTLDSPAWEPDINLESTGRPG